MSRISTARERLLEATINLVTEHGYGSVTVDDICSLADIKKGSFYYFFASKSALTVAAIEHFWKTFYQPALDRLFAASINPLQRIDDYLRWLRKLQLERKRQQGTIPGPALELIGCELVAEEPEIAEKVREILARELPYFRAAIRDARDRRLIGPCEPTQQALYLRALIKGILSEARITNNEALLDLLAHISASLLRSREVPDGKPVDPAVG